MLRLDVFCARRYGGNAKGVLEGDGILDEAGGEGFLQSTQLPLIQTGDDDLDLEAPETQGALAGLGLDANEQAFRGEVAQFEVLSDILTDAAAEGCEQ